MTTAEIKQKLNTVRETERRYRLAKDKYAAYMQLLTCGKTIRYKNDGAVHERDGNPVERAYCQLADYEAEKDRLLGELVTARKEAKKMINLIQDRNQHNVICKYYICAMSWDDIAFEMGYSVRWVQKLHGYALKNISKALDSSPTL